MGGSLRRCCCAAGSGWSDRPPPPCAGVAFARQFYLHLPVAVDPRRAAIRNLDRRFLAVFLNAEHDAQPEAQPADQQQEDHHRNGRLPAA